MPAHYSDGDYQQDFDAVTQRSAFLDLKLEVITVTVDLVED